MHIWASTESEALENWKFIKQNHFINLFTTSFCLLFKTKLNTAQNSYTNPGKFMNSKLPQQPKPVEIPTTWLHKNDFGCQFDKCHQLREYVSRWWTDRLEMKEKSVFLFDGRLIFSYVSPALYI